MTLLLIVLAAAFVIWLVARANRASRGHSADGQTAEHSRHRGC